MSACMSEKQLRVLLTTALCIGIPGRDFYLTQLGESVDFQKSFVICCLVWIKTGPARHLGKSVYSLSLHYVVKTLQYFKLLKKLSLT